MDFLSKILFETQWPFLAFLYHQCFCWLYIFALQPLLFYCHSIIWSVQLVKAQEIHWQTAVFMGCLYLIINLKCVVGDESMTDRSNENATADSLSKGKTHFSDFPYCKALENAMWVLFAIFSLKLLWYVVCFCHITE